MIARIAELAGENAIMRMALNLIMQITGELAKLDDAKTLAKVALDAIKEAKR